MFNDGDRDRANELVEAIKFFSQKGWSPATSTNYSVRSTEADQYIISRSGVDKSKFQLSDLILINPEGEVQDPFRKPGVKSSAETEIHTFLYGLDPSINCVLHTHSVLGTVLSKHFERDRWMCIDGFEVLKGIEGNTTHQFEEILPIVPNSQEMRDIIWELKPHLDTLKKAKGFLIAGHGLYAFGKDIAQAKRHIETYEFLFECLYAMRRL